MKMNIQIGEQTFTASLENNAAVRELAEMMKSGPVVIHMEDYSGFEKVGSLGRSLTASDRQTTTKPGDIVSGIVKWKQDRRVLRQQFMELYPDWEN